MPLRPACAFLLLAVLVALAYAPGIRGGFVFDDYFAVVLNDELDIDPARPGAVLDAAFSSTSGPLRRPVAMLSFAVNRTLNGTDPLPYKLTNVAIHAVNALLVLTLLRMIASVLALSSGFLTPAVAWLAAAWWAVHPINLTSVLYVVQRMTSLCSTWMLLALVAYAVVRTRQIRKLPVARSWWAAVFGAGLLGVFTKETAILLPLYFCVLEYTVFRFEAGGRLRSLYRGGLLLGACAAAGALILAPEAILGGYAARSFSPGERLLTEARVLLFYMRLIAVPDLSSFALFHDDFEISRGLLSPLSTLPSVVALGLLAGTAFVTRRPYVAFGIGWFMVGHLLESTVYPLELVHEHRNYLPAIGFTFMIAAGASELFGRLRWQRGGPAVALAALAVFGAATAIRASIWADPATQIAYDALHHPGSARSQYELGRIRLERGAATEDPQMRAAGVAAMERAAVLSSLPTLALTALLNSGVEDGDRSRVERVLAALRREDRDRVRVEVFQQFVQCQAYGRCAAAPDAVGELADTILGGPPLAAHARLQVVEWLAIYYMRVLGDAEAALEMLSELAAQPGASYITRARYAEALFGTGRFEEAAEVARRVRETLPWKAVFTERPLRRRLDLLIDPGAADA